MVCWSRNEREAADTRRGAVLAQRVVSAVALRRRRRRVLWCVVTAVAACVLASSMMLAGGNETQHPAALDDQQTAEIYAAAISNGSPHKVGHPVLVRDAVCAAIPDPRAMCAGGPSIPPAVRARVIQLLGSGVRFVADPPPPARRDGPWTVAFGRLTRTGGRVTLGVERHCGPLCGSGRTTVLARQDGHWTMTGTTGPAWNN